MKTLVQSMRGKGASAPLLPDIHPLVADAGVRVRRGQMLMITATPGGGKSLLALHYCVKQHPGRVLYFSLDTDIHTMRQRTAAMLMGISTDEVEQFSVAGEDEYVERALDDLSSEIRWCTNARTMQDIDDELSAYSEVFGSMPDLVVIDVLLNLDGGGDDWSGSMQVMSDLHELAHAENVAVMVLHHNAERRTDQTTPAPRSEMIMKVAQYPEVVLSLALAPEENELRVAATKNRSGKADPKAESWVSLPVDLETMTIFNTKDELVRKHKMGEWT